MCVLCSHRVTTPVMLLVIDLSFSRLVSFGFVSLPSLPSMGQYYPFGAFPSLCKGVSVVSSVLAHLSTIMFTLFTVLLLVTEPMVGRE